ncbi:MAG TPA: TraB/GumN family protein [Kofleriaceae bacterium]|nr:TraB/GumN family protein [Kofleriaceae bacterium]
MKQRVSLFVAAAVVAAAACGKKNDTTSSGGSATASGSDPWAGSAKASGAVDANDCPPPPTTATPAAVTAKLVKPFFFHATKPGMANVWLFGTIHIGVTPDAVPDSILEKLDKSERFAMEADITPSPDLLESIMRNDGKTLADDVGPVVWHKFVCAVGKMQASNAEHMKPSLAATVLDVQGLPTTEALDSFLFQRAKKGGKGIVFLEPAKKQLALLDKWMDAREIVWSVDHLDEIRKNNVELIDSYTAGDEAKAIEMSKDDSEFVKSGRTHDEFVQFMKELLLDRNASWIDEIEGMAKKGDAFVAVGAMHLLGDGSVIDLLQKKGWKIERVAP